MRAMSLDRQRLIVQGSLAFGVLAGATFLALVEHVITSDAVVGLYSVALGAVGAGAVGGSRASAPPPNGSDLPAEHPNASTGSG